MSGALVVCVDFGSTFTKAALVDRVAGRLLATAQHPTTLDTDLLDGYDACLRELVAAHPEAADARTLACSSAGGGLRIAVLGNEELVTAEAGRRVALSSGGKVVCVLSGGLDAARLDELRAAEPDVLLLVGGTDGGNAEQLLGDAAALSRAAWPGPVVVAGDSHSRASVTAALGAVAHVLADNVVPRIGVLAPDSARHAIREVFLSHVIGGKDLSRRPEFATMVLGATPDVVLTGVELLAEAHGSTAPGSGVVVVDVGGATTDVHSVVVLDPEDASLAREVVAVTPVTRTVEGDLGMVWSRDTTVTAGAEAGLLDAADSADDLRLATVASLLALRRHAGRSRVLLSAGGKVVERSGKNLRGVDLVVASGGVFRADPDGAVEAVRPATGPDPDGWQLPERPRVVVDTSSVLAAAGLIALHGDDEESRAVARLLICNSVSGVDQEGSTS
jgi:hypothetical protein